MPAFLPNDSDASDPRLHIPAGGRPHGGTEEAGEGVQALLERALGLPLGTGRVAEAGIPAGGADAGRSDGPSDAVVQTHLLPRSPGERTHLRGLAAGLALVVALGIAYVAVDRIESGRGRGSPPRETESGGDESGTTTETAGPNTAGSVERLLSVVPAEWRGSCRPAPGLDEHAMASVSCAPVPDGLSVVELHAFEDVSRMRARYATVAAARAPSGRSGAPRCASGRREERGWAAPEAPRRKAGRYACRIDDGAATLWWTTDRARVMVRAVRPDADLEALFDWWLSGEVIVESR